MTEPVDLFDDLDIEALRRRTSAKWRRYGDAVLPAWVAEMDFPLAPPIAALLHAMVESSDTGYGWPGDLPLAVAEDQHRRFGLTVDPGQVLIVGDVLSGLAAVLRALTAPGDGVIVTPPVYPPFFTTVADVAGRRVVDVALVRDGDAYRLDVEALDRAMAHPDVTAVVLCSPHNPTGSVPTREELVAVAESAARHGVTVVSDEIHAPLTMPGVGHVPFLSVGGEAAASAVALVSASKAFNIPGLKCAQILAGSPALARRLDRAIPMEVRLGAGLLGIRAQVVAYREGQPWLDRVVATVDRNRHLLARLLEQRLPEIGYRPPDATYLAWLDCRGLGLGDDPALALLDRGRVALSPGPTFGAGGAGHVRLNLATSAGILTEIVDRMAVAVGR